MQSTTRKFPGFDVVFKIDEGFSRQAYRGEVELPPRFPYGDLNLLTRGELHIESPIVIRYAMGGDQLKDVVCTTSVAPFIISQRIVDILATNEFTGWSTYPVEVYNKNGKLVEGYSGLSIHGRCGPIDESKCVEVFKELPGGVFPVYRGYYFDPDSWDGSDLFTPSDGMLFMFAVKSVKEALTRAKVTNLKFRRLDEAEYPRLRRKE